jgi:hypothetical protein
LRLRRNTGRGSGLSVGYGIPGATHGDQCHQKSQDRGPSQQAEGPCPEATRRQAEKIISWRLAVNLEPFVCISFHLRLWNCQLSLAIFAIDKLTGSRFVHT